MKNSLGEQDFNLYIDSLDKPSTHGMTINLNKLKNSSIDLEYLLEKFNGKLLYKNSKYAYIMYDKDELAKNSIFPGKDPLHHAGLYYIQEPSAAEVINSVDINSSDLVLDLCASPGGKTIETLCSLSKKDGGFVIANEIDYKRAKILSSNIERMGFENVAITCENSTNLANKFVEYFDKVIVDAPCSGEGMFRKSEDAREQWSEALVKSCASLQKCIIEDAYKMLKNGGILIYSTCTFSKDEDENVVEYITDKYKDLRILNTKKIFPFESLGEGQFYAILSKGEQDSTISRIPYEKDFKGLNLIRYGVDKIEKDKKDEMPTHASTHVDDIVFENTVELNDDEVEKYLRGEAINKDLLNKGFYKVTYKNLGVGLAKYSNNMLKNHYPKGLRNF